MTNFNYHAETHEWTVHHYSFINIVKKKMHKRFNSLTFDYNLLVAANISRGGGKFKS